MNEGKTNIAVVEDTGEMRKWRGLSQSEMDPCWKNLPGRMEEEVLENTRSKKAQERPSEVEVPPGMEEGTGKQEIRNEEVGRRLLGKNFLFVYRIQLAASAT